MGREYGGILGFLAFTTVLARSFVSGGGFDDTIGLALIMLFAFAGVGYVIGNIAEQTVRESVLSILESKVQALDADEETTSMG